MPFVSLIKKKIIGKTGYLNQIVFDAFKTILLTADIPAHYKLPSSRQLAIDLEISRNTAMLVYEQLLLEGYIYTVTGSGTFTKQRFNNGPHQSLTTNLPLSKRGYSILKNTYSSSNQAIIPFSPFSPDISLFPHKSFNKIVNSIRQSIDYNDLHYTSDAGDKELKKAISSYLEQSRSIKCSPDQILIFSSTNEALTLLSHVLCDPSDHVIMENPTYWGFRNIFKFSNLNIHNIDVDSKGLIIDELYNMPISPKFIMVTPARQYPLGHVLSINRRLQLLEYAKKNQAWIIEDDYDSEFSLTKYSISSLYSFSPDSNVIYSGSFSKSIYPSIQVSYLIVPTDLKQDLIKAHGVLYRNSNKITQRALAIFIEKGEYALHLKSVKTIYFKRRQQLIKLLHQYLGKDFIENTSYLNTGLHIHLNFPDHWDDNLITKILSEQGISSSALSNYYAIPPIKKGLLLGFANIDEGLMEEPVRALSTIIKNYASTLNHR